MTVQQLAGLISSLAIIGGAFYVWFDSQAAIAANAEENIEQDKKHAEYEDILGALTAIHEQQAQQAAEKAARDEARREMCEDGTAAPDWCARQGYRVEEQAE